MSEAFGAPSSRLRLFADTIHDALMRLDGGEDVTDLLQEKLLQCRTMLEASPEASKLAAVERTAIGSFIRILREVLTVLKGPKDRLSALRRRLGHGRNANTGAYVDDCKPRIAEWRKRVEDAIDLREIEARVILQDMGFATSIGGGTPSRTAQRAAPPPPSTAVETTGGLTVDAVLALRESLLAHAESSSARIDILVRNHDQVLNVAGISEREREHMQRMEEQVAALNVLNAGMVAQVAALNARQKRTDIMLCTPFFFSTPSIGMYFAVHEDP